MTERRPRISVIICAYTPDRWDDLREAIESLQRQTRVPDEILVVIDHNPDLLARARAGLPGVTVLANQEERGLSGGRNTGIARAQGDLLLFFDDDAVAAEDLVERLERRCREPGVLGATNPVQPIWVGPRPGWFPDEFLWTVGCTFPGAELLGGGEVRNLMGGSMMLHRKVFDRVGGFNHRLGRTENNTSLISCEETELCIRAKAAFPEERFMSDAAASIGHKVGAARLTLRYFCRRTYAEGMSKARIAALSARAGALDTERGYVLRVLSRAVLRNLGTGLFRLDRHALGRAGAIILGLGCAGLGFARGRRIRAATAPVARPPAAQAGNIVVGG